MLISIQLIANEGIFPQVKNIKALGVIKDFNDKV